MLQDTTAQTQKEPPERPKTWRFILGVGGMIAAMGNSALTHLDTKDYSSWWPRIVIGLVGCAIGGVVIGIAGRRWRDAEIAMTDPAEEVWRRTKAAGLDYAVFLRNFDIERPGLESDVRTLQTGSIDSFYAGGTDLESNLVKGFGEMPVFGLVDPSSPHSYSGIHRLRAAPGDWMETLRPLLEDARVIVLHFAKETPGVGRELSILSDPAFKEKTVIIVDQSLGYGKDARARGLREKLEASGRVLFEQEGRWDLRYDLMMHVRLEKMLPSVYDSERVNGKGLFGWLRKRFRGDAKT